MPSRYARASELAEDETPEGDEPDAAAATPPDSASDQAEEAEEAPAAPLADTPSVEADAAEEAPAVPLGDMSSAEADAAEEVPAVPLGDMSSADDDVFPVETLMEALRQAKVSELLISTVSTLASVAYGKLEAADLPEARLAIDAIGVLLPLLAGRLAEPILRDLEQALANLRLAYADAVSGGQ